jgi:hypothetical protein
MPLICEHHTPVSPSVWRHLHDASISSVGWKLGFGEFEEQVELRARAALSISSA